ncbi:MAG: hypothetical protein V2A62_03650 [Candidatus Woesearchaeota archaeon]
MPELMSIDEVVAVMKEFSVERVEGNIVFPTHHQEIPLDRYARMMGVELLFNQFGHPKDPSQPYVYPVSGKEEEHYLCCHSVKFFEEALRMFKTERQLPPFSIKGDYGNKVLVFTAKQAELYNGRVKSYNYLSHQDFDKLRSERV